MTLTRRTVIVMFLTPLSLALSQGKKEDVANVQWMRLRGLNYKTGRVNDDVKALDGALIRIEGYPVPLEDEMKDASEFLLVSSSGACIHTPPPPPNQIIHIKMPANKRAKVEIGKLYWVTGRMQILTVKSPYGDVAFEMQGLSVEPSKDN
jgi:uncharacterized protein